MAQFPQFKWDWAGHVYRMIGVVAGHEGGGGTNKIGSARTERLKTRGFVSSESGGRPLPRSRTREVTKKNRNKVIPIRVKVSFVVNAVSFFQMVILKNPYDRKGLLQRNCNFDGKNRTSLSLTCTPRVL